MSGAGRSSPSRRQPEALFCVNSFAFFFLIGGNQEGRAPPHDSISPLMALLLIALYINYHKASLLPTAPSKRERAPSEGTRGRRKAQKRRRKAHKRSRTGGERKRDERETLLFFSFRSLRELTEAAHRAAALYTGATCLTRGGTSGCHSKAAHEERTEGRSQ
jgi:hypothetical protein